MAHLGTEWIGRRLTHKQSHHYASQKKAVLSTSIHRANWISDNQSLTDELQYLERTLKQNGYRTQEIRKALRPCKNDFEQSKSSTEHI